MHIASGKQAWRTRGFIAAALLAWLPLAGLAADQPVTIAAFDPLANQQGCVAKGELAYRVAFTAQQALVRFGIKRAATRTGCTIKTRRGGQITEIAIPCENPPENLVGGAQSQESPETVLGAADFSGEILGCAGLTTHRFLRADWQIKGSSPFGPFEMSGNIDSPGFSIAFKGLRTGTAFGGMQDFLVTPPTLLLAFYLVPVPLNRGQAVDLSSYLVVAPSAVPVYTCFAWKDCRASPSTAGAYLGKDFAGGLVRYVDGE